MSFLVFWLVENSTIPIEQKKPCLRFTFYEEKLHSCRRQKHSVEVHLWYICLYFFDSYFLSILKLLLTFNSCFGFVMLGILSILEFLFGIFDVKVCVSGCLRDYYLAPIGIFVFIFWFEVYQDFIWEYWNYFSFGFWM